jgi:hypothetical protein
MESSFVKKIATAFLLVKISHCKSLEVSTAHFHSNDSILLILKETLILLQKKDGLKYWQTTTLLSKLQGKKS